MPSIRFLGGTSTVTGSKFLVEGASGSVLVDCGMFQGKREVSQRNWNGPFNTLPLPSQVLLTHAHIDHTGHLPRLVGKHGFEGPILATSATVDLLGVMLPDSARIQEEQAAHANKKGYSRHKPALPLYTQEDAAAALRLLRPVRYHEWFDIEGGRAKLNFAGHILGSAAYHDRGRRQDNRFLGRYREMGRSRHQRPAATPQGRHRGDGVDLRHERPCRGGGRSR